MSENDGSDLLEREDIGDVTVVRVKVSMLRSDDMTDNLFGQVYSLIDDAGRQKLVLNLAVVEYLASVALGKLVVLIRKTRAADGRLALCHVTRSVSRLLEITYLADLMSIYGEERDAVQSFA